MVGIKNTLIIALFILSSAFMPLTGLIQVAQGQEVDKGTTDTSQSTIDSEAFEVLNEMSDALISLKEFTFDTEITNDVSLTSGETIQFSGTMKTSVKRPDHVYAIYTGDSGTREAWYNGNQITIYNESKKFYGQLKTPDSIDETMDFLMTNYGFSLPLADILTSDPYDSFMETTVGGMVVGNSSVRGKECTHLAFIGKYVDWQLWVADKKPALPCKLVINYKEIEGAPQYQAIFSNWNLSPDLSDSVFKANLPKDSVKIDFIDFKKQKGATK